MGFKYKLKEQEQDLPQVSKGGNFKVGDVKISGGTKYTVRNIDPETGAIAWKVESVPAIGSTFKESFQKAIRGLEIGKNGLDGAEKKLNKSSLRAGIISPTPDRIYFIAEALKMDYSICSLTILD